MPSRSASSARSALRRAGASSGIVFRRGTRILGTLAAFIVASCADSASSTAADAASVDADVPEDESALIAADLCEHATEGPFKALTATADAASAPEAYFSHTFLTVAGSGAAGRQFIKLSVSEAGEHVLGTTGLSGLTITDSAGTAVTIEEEEAVTACTGIETAYHVPLGIGTFAVSFELAGADGGMVILTGEHEEDEAQ